MERRAAIHPNRKGGSQKLYHSKAPEPPRRLTRWEVIEVFGGCLPVTLPDAAAFKTSGQPDRQRKRREAIVL